MSAEKTKLALEETTVDTKKSNSRTIWILCTAILAIVIALMLCIIIALAVVLGVERGRGDGDDPQVCLTNGCVQASAQIQSGLNESVDPCEDFYQFACGNWIRNNVIPSGEGRYTVLAKIREDSRLALRKVLEGGDDKGVDAVRKAIDLYISCLNTDTINRLGATPILELITETGGWTLVGIPEDNQWSVNDTNFIQEHLYGSAAFFQASITNDLANPTIYTLVVSQGSLSLPVQDYYQNPLFTSTLKDFYVTILTLLNSTIDRAIYENATQEVIDFESELAKITLSPLELRDIGRIYNVFTVGDLSTLWPDFDWLNFFEEIFEIGGLTLSNEEPVIVTSPDYLRNLTTLFRNTNTRTLQNYAKLQIVTPYLSYLGNEFREALQQFQEVISGIQGDEDRQTVCIRRVQSVFPIAVARPYVEDVVLEGTKETVSMMIDYINEAFKERLDELAWLDETTRERSKEKVDAVLRLIAYPDRLFEDEYLNDLSSEYEVTRDGYFRNGLGSSKHIFRQAVRRFREVVNRTEWPINLSPTDVNAYYNPTQNIYVFLAGILAPPMFSADWPDYLNFGGIGYVIGHELTHGFDDQGQGFDKDGVRRQWWTSASQSEFNERKQCFVDQYSQYKYDKTDAQVIGELTLGENIADNGGSKTAFQAYRKRMNNGGMDMKLLSMDYTPDQLFFIALGQVWCSIYEPQFAQVLSQTAVHSPGNARVIGPLVNNPEFAEAFNCPVGSPMNPPTEEKCFLW